MQKSLLIFFFFISFVTLGQESVSIPDAINYFKIGKECFDNQQYVAARFNFRAFLAGKEETYTERLTEAQYYIICADYFGGKYGVEEEMKQFAEKHQGSHLANDMNFKLACLYFDKEKFRYASRAFEACEEALLTENQKEEYRYRLGYTYFSLKDKKRAKPLFKSSSESGGKYEDEALYYYSFLQYQDGHYDAALKGFETLHQKQMFEETVPYCMAQIYALKGEYEKLTVFAPNYLKQADEKNQAEMNRIVGNAYYQMGKYEEAVVHLENYRHASAEKPQTMRTDLYHLGVAYYNREDYAKAAEVFSQITAQDDPMTQSAYAYLGECFVKQGDKERARLAFETASKYKFDPILREDAYYNYVKLSYETAISPFSGTINLLEGFLDEFPESEYTLEMYDLMYKSYMTTANYREACNSIERLKHKDARLLLARQRVMYYRGVELYNNGYYKEAEQHFKRSLEGNPHEKTLKALAFYWSGEACYQRQKYEEAIKYFKQFVSTAGAYALDEFGIAHYNTGYSHFKLHHYDEAITWFRKFMRSGKTSEKDWKTDANNRVGDCFYLKRDFREAVKYYNLAIENGGNGVDYAYFQKGFCQGLSHQYDSKVLTMSRLMNEIPESPYADDALYEKARANVILENYSDAIADYKRLPQLFPHSKYASKALLNAALAYYNSGDYQQASLTYKLVVDKYQGTEEAHAAMVALKNISIEQNTVNEYIAYAKEVGGKDMQQQQEDSLNFLAAEKLYMAQRFEEAIKAFENYTQHFKNGTHLLVAHFYMADAHMQLARPTEATKHLEYIVSRPHSLYTEQSLSVLSTMYFRKNQYYKALENYKRLLENAGQKENITAAKIGIMECNYALNEAGATILAVDDLLKESLPQPTISRAHYYKATSYLALKNEEAAQASFEILAEDLNTPYGAEAKYRIAEILHRSGKAEKAKTEIFDFINKGSSEQYWLAKTFILLSDIYAEEDDLFQARQYLLSINDNYKQDDDILDIVNEKLTAVTAKEQQQNKEKRRNLDLHFSSDSIQ